MDLLNYLKQEPRARERKNKNRTIGNMVLQKYKIAIDHKSDTIGIDKGIMADIVGEILSLDRKWRKILEENPDLRGTDYKDGEILSQRKQIELGYVPGYESDIKKLKTLN